MCFMHVPKSQVLEPNVLDLHGFGVLMQNLHKYIWVYLSNTFAGLV
jgi:hypothetical protein